MTTLSQTLASDALTSGRLPRFTVPVVAVAALLVGIAVASLFAGGNLALAAVLGFVLYLLAMEIAARVVEGARQASDRRATTLVTGAFILALLPLGSVAWEAISTGNNQRRARRE